MKVAVSLFYFSWISSLTCFSFTHCRCQLFDEMMDPLRVHLAPSLSDAVVVGVVGSTSKRLEAAIKKVSN